jgi:hypothetical protein
MKKLLLILLCLPMIGFGQTAEDYYNKAEDFKNNGKYQLAIDKQTTIKYLLTSCFCRLHFY